MKVLSLTFALMLFIAALSGCSNTSATAPPQATDDAQQQAAARTAYAKIKSVYGNEITVVFADEQRGRPENGDGSQAAPSGDPPEQSDGTPAATSAPVAEGEQTQRGQRQPPSEGSSGAPSGEGSQQRGSRPDASSSAGGMPSREDTPPADAQMPSGDASSGFSGFPSGEMPSGGQGRGQSTGQFASLSFTGDEAVYLISPSVTVTSGSGQSAQVIRFTQLSEKAVVQLSFDEHDNLIAIAVLQ